MNPELENLFEQAVGLAATEREQFLAEHCSDPDLRRELELLLAQDQGAETFLQRAVSEEASSALQTFVFTPGQRLGPYRVLSIIGRGGMGLVYLAERADGKFEQHVAIKVLQSGVDPSWVNDRTQQECRILASLEHPNIARVLDADVSHDGLPYFVMEYVDGLPLDRYCERHHLSLRDRLRLLLPLCDALHLAHQKLIVHRDLKPDNILVTGQGVPKLLDFGIAKVLGEVPLSPHTATRILTPEYASPEQARGEPVTTATDIYSLGGVLYKLATGSTPHQTKDKGPMEMVRAICEEEVHRPSELRRELSGEIDSILLKALHTDPQQRYRSVDQFAADLQRWLEGRPVLAVPPSLAYRAHKFGRRHRVALATASAVTVALVAASVVSIREGIRANRETAVAEAVNEFLQNDLLAQAGASFQSGPSTKPDPDLKVRTALDRAAERIGGKFAKQPEVEASIRDTMGMTYVDLGLYPEARKQLERALELRRRGLETEDARTLKTTARLGWVAHLQGKYAEAEVLESKALEAQRRVLGPEHRDTLGSMNYLAVIYDDEGKYAQAEALDVQTLEIRKRLLGPEHPDTLRSISNLAVDYVRDGKYAQGEGLLTQALQTEKRVLGPEHPDTLASETNLAAVYFQEGKYAQAEALFTQELEIRKRVLGPEHPDTAQTLYNLACAAAQRGDKDRAIALLSQSVDHGLPRNDALGIENDRDLTSLHGDPRFLALVARAKQVAEAKQKAAPTQAPQ
jgi:eukaryotic-like serine/threonine-protein kinase